MNRRPWAFTVFAVLMLGVALGFPIQVAFLQDVTQVLRSLTWLNIAIMALSVTTAWAALSAHPILRALIPLNFGFIVLNNWWVGHVGLDFSIAQTTLASTAFLALHGVLLEKNSLRVLKNPKLQWWTRPVRNQVHVPVVLFPWASGSPLRKASFDISETGVFVTGFDDSELSTFKPGEKFQLRLNLSGHAVISCTGVLVRKSKGTGTYPPGVGFCFENLTWNDRQHLRHLSERPAPQEQPMAA